MIGEHIFLPVKTEATGRVGFIRKVIADLNATELEYQQALAALGPRPDKDYDGANEYNDWLAKANKVTENYLSKL